MFHFQRISSNSIRSLVLVVVFVTHFGQYFELMGCRLCRHFYIHHMHTNSEFVKCCDDSMEIRRVEIFLHISARSEVEAHALNELICRECETRTFLLLQSSNSSEFFLSFFFFSQNRLGVRLHHDLKSCDHLLFFLFIFIISANYPGENKESDASEKRSERRERN